jgi:hypothetical protein
MVKSSALTPPAAVAAGPPKRAKKAARPSSTVVSSGTRDIVKKCGSCPTLVSSITCGPAGKEGGTTNAYSTIVI